MTERGQGREGERWSVAWNIDAGKPGLLWHSCLLNLLLCCKTDLSAGQYPEESWLFSTCLFSNPECMSTITSQCTYFLVLITSY